MLVTLKLIPKSTLQRAWPAGKFCSGPWSLLPATSITRSLPLPCASLGCPPFPCLQAKQASKCFVLKLRPRNLCPDCSKEAGAKFDLGKK